MHEGSSHVYLQNMAIEEVPVGGAGGYLVHVGEGLLKEIPRLLREKAEEKKLSGKDVFILTDRHVARYYLKSLAKPLKKAGYRVSWSVQKVGEKLKSMANLHRLLRLMTDQGLSRDSYVIALGGGVIGDLGGFAAAIYMRGCHLIQVPTTLLAQVDSSIGGKVGINLKEGKNLIGAFHNPLFVAIDPSTLGTLDAREVAAGFAEVIKYGLIFKKKLFSEIESLLNTGTIPLLNASNSSLTSVKKSPLPTPPGRVSPSPPRGGSFAEELKRSLLSDMDFLTRLIIKSVKIKAEIVTADERENDLRMILNFGHTFGHAVEKLTGYRRFLHGEAVLLGMEMAVELSSAAGMLPPSDAARALNLLRLFELPPIKGLSPKAIYRQIARDKKRRGGRVHYILLKEIGSAIPEPAVEKRIVLQSIEKALKMRRKQ